MNKRRYDEVIALVASVLFGIAVQYYPDVVKNLAADLGKVASHLVVATVFLVFFRNIHGLIAYDAFIENNDYQAPYEEKTRHIVIYFGFGFFAALVLPYLIIYLLYNHFAYWKLHHNWFALFYLAPLLIYWLWNGFWLCKLLKNEPAPPTAFTVAENSTFAAQLSSRINRLLAFALNHLRPLAEDRASKRQIALLSLVFPFAVAVWAWERWRKIPCEHKPYANKAQTVTVTLGGSRVTVVDGRSSDAAQTNPNANKPFSSVLRWTLLWCLIDFTTCLLVMICLGGLWIGHRSNLFASLCIGFAVISLVSLAIDYCTHAKFYFPLPARDAAS